MARRSVDGVMRPQAAGQNTGLPPPRPTGLQQAAAQASPQMPQRRTFTAPASVRPRRRWWQALLFPAGMVLCLCGSFLVQSLPLGMLAIAVYAVIAWLRRIPSRVSFILALLALATVVILLVVRQNVDLASNFATYTFLLIVVGTVSSMLESRVSKRRTHKMRR